MIRYNTKQLKHLAMKSLSKYMNVFLTAYLIYFAINTASSYLLSIFTGVSTLLDPETGTLLPSLSASDLAIYLISSYIITLILSVLDVGFNKMFLSASRETPFTWKMMFDGFKGQPDRILIVQLILSAISLVCTAPGYIIIFIANHKLAGQNIPEVIEHITQEMLLVFLLMILGLLVMLIGMIPSYYFTVLFSQSMFLLAEHEEMGAIASLKESKRLMHKNKMRYFILILSFIPLHLLCYMTCNIGTFFLYPFIGMTNAFFYRNIIGEIGEHESVLYS